MYERILLAYDGSVKGRAALREGALLAKRVGAEVFLLSVIAEVPGTRVSDGAGGAGMAQQNEDYKAVLRDGKRRLERLGLRPTAKLVIGEPAAEIGAFARQIAADLVVVGHHRRSALGRWWSGPSGAYLIDHIPCSMLVSQNVVSDETFAAVIEGDAAGGLRVNTLPAPAAPQAPAAVVSDQPPLSRHTTTSRRLRWGLYAVLAVALLVAVYGYIRGGQVVTLNDAYINADKVGISTDVAGIVQQVDVIENQTVQAGQLLYRIDELPFQLALQRAEAQLGMARDSLNALMSNYRDAQAQLTQAQYDMQYYLTEFRRVQDLFQAHVASQTSFDTARRNLQSARQKLASVQQQLAAVGANLHGGPHSPIEQNPRYMEALAQRDEAARQLAHSVVRAPFAGTVTNVPSIAPGKYLQVMATAFFLVATDHVWVDANPKETELTYVRPGQAATVTVDTYPGRRWPATVESISPAAAQQFSLLPAQNTSGNWVKVVQRIPMRVRVDTSDRELPPLRAGMSVEVAVNTQHPRGLPHFLTGSAGHRGQQ